MSTEVFFNRPGKPLGIERLYREIRAASVRLTVASAWFTDTHIAQAIIEAPAPDKLVLLNAADLGRGDKRAVTMIKEATRHTESLWDAWHKRRDAIGDRWVNAVAGRKWSSPELDGVLAAWDVDNPPPGSFRMVVLGSRDFTQGVMHHKFIVIDDVAAWTGSFNFTFNAQRNYENLIRIADPAIVARFHEEAKECGAPLWTDDDGMYRCDECGARFYPDEHGIEDLDSHGTQCCKKCRDAPVPLMDLSYEIPAPPPTPIRGRLPVPRPVVTPPPSGGPIKPLRQLRIGKKP